MYKSGALSYNTPMMWPFKRKKQEAFYGIGPRCPHCGRSNTRLQIGSEVTSPDYVKTWRGQRSVAYRCRDCGYSFYADEPPPSVFEDGLGETSEIVEDEQALADAEEELRQEIEEDDDRRFQ